MAIFVAAAQRRTELSLHGSHVCYKSRLLAHAGNVAQQVRNMAEVAPSAVVIPADVPQKPPPKSKKGASIYKLIVAIVAESKERKGMSLTALKKALAVKGVNVAKGNKRINNAVTKLVTGGTLSRTKGTGACGSFKIAKPKREPKVADADPKKAVKKKAPAKAKRPAGKKASAPKKPANKRAAAKRSPKKSPAKKVVRKVKKSPKKTVARRPKTVKRPKAAKKPKPARRPAARRPVAKKRPVKRRPATKARRY
ncbi:histone H1-like [Xiphophorus couchianus]|uniref:histone H1-like n=1 Tax=Xiphophorus couchianus TaxID=32473 RepID=UPI001015E823|nr:histone H1-like [Xiphophorus couchianus]